MLKVSLCGIYDDDVFACSMIKRKGREEYVVDPSLSYFRRSCHTRTLAGTSGPIGAYVLLLEASVLPSISQAFHNGIARFTAKMPNAINDIHILLTFSVSSIRGYQRYTLVDELGTDPSIQSPQTSLVGTEGLVPTHAHLIDNKNGREGCMLSTER